MGGQKIDRTFEVVLRERAAPSLDEGDRALLLRPMAAGVALVVGCIAGWSKLGPALGAVGLGVGLVLLRLAANAAGRVKPRYTTVTTKMRVEISAAGIKPVGERFVPREEIAEAYFQPREGTRSTVRCVDRAHAVLFEAEVDDEEDAEEILEALGKDASHRRSEFRMAAPFLVSGAVWQLMLVFTMAGFVLGGTLLARWGWAASAPAWAALVAMWSAVSMRQRVEVGVDGVLTRWMGRTRFIAFERIEEVVTAPTCVELHLRGGERVRLCSAEAQRGPREASLVVDALAARIHEAMRAHGRGADAAELAAYVSRGDRPIAAWRADLQRLHDPERQGGYRSRAARGEDLWRVVEDTTAPEDARAGAAVALRSEAGAHPRLRVAAEAVASPKLRVALERAADPAADEAALDDALEAFAAERADR